MGGGGLRILPHKKWHVWRRDNIERVLRDEREHEEQQRAAEAQQRRLEQERRAQTLLPEGEREREHVNFFRAEEAAARDVQRPRHGKDDTLRRHGELPWYAQAEEKQPTARQERKRKRELEGADPLQLMRPKEEQLSARSKETGRPKRRLEEEGPAGSDRRKYSARYDRSSASPDRKERRGCRTRHEDDADDSKKRCKHHKEKKSKHKLSKKEALLQELRREREEREAKERRRADRVMYG